MQSLAMMGRVLGDGVGRRCAGMCHGLPCIQQIKGAADGCRAAKEGNDAQFGRAHGAAQRYGPLSLMGAVGAHQRQAKGGGG